MNWTETRDRLIECDVDAARLPEAWQVGINLREANLRGANLSEANLRGANLRGADLIRAFGPFTTGFFGKHHAIAAGGYISIGCKRYTYDEWLERYEIIGEDNCYTAEEIADYGAWIKLAVARQRRIETEVQS